MKKLINTYKQGDSTITQFETGKGLIDLDGTAFVEVESYKNGKWCDTQLVEATKHDSVLEGSAPPENYDSWADYERDQEQARETIQNGDY